MGDEAYEQAGFSMSAQLGPLWGVDLCRACLGSGLGVSSVELLQSLGFVLHSGWQVCLVSGLSVNSEGPT